MTEQEALNALKKIEDDFQIAGKARMVAEFFEGLSIAEKALEKQIPKKPIYNDFEEDDYGEMVPCEAVCPTCGYEFEFLTWADDENHHCICGQKIDWE